MSTTTVTIPGDIVDVYHELGWMLPELTDVMAEEVKEWRSELRQAVKDWKAGGAEPDWGAFRDWMNDICRDDGMPILFPQMPVESDAL